MRERDLFIDGRWRAGAERPAARHPRSRDGELVGSTALADAADVDLGRRRGRARAAGLGRIARRRARRILHRAADLIVERLADDRRSPDARAG